MKRFIVLFILVISTILSSCTMLNMDQLRGVDVYSLDEAKKQDIDAVFGEGYSDSCTVVICSFSDNQDVSFISNGALGTYVEEYDTIYINGDYSVDNDAILFFEYGIRWCVKELGRNTSGARSGLCMNDVPKPKSVQESILSASHYNASVEANIVAFYYASLSPRGCYTSSNPDAYLSYMKTIMRLPIDE